MLLNALCSALGDKMAFGGKLTILGIAIVFILLGVIVVILTVMEKVNKKLAEKPKSGKKSLKDLFKKKGDDAVISDKPVENVIVPTEIKVENDDEVVATIMGALSVILDDEGNNSKFVVKKIKKLSFRR